MTEKPDKKQDGDVPVRKQLSLSELLPKERMKLGVRVSTWQDAVREAGKLLQQSGAVTSGYIDAMIKVAEELGPYIVIAPGIALPHAATKDGAIQTAMSLVKLAEPINFGNPDHDPVRLVLGLSAVDKKEHMLALKTLAEIFLVKDLVDRFHQAESVDSITEVLKMAEARLEH